VYNIICDSLGLEPKPNNGTLRLPLKTIGVHSSDTSLPDPVDPADTSNTDGSINVDPIEAGSAADGDAIPPYMIGVNPADDATTDSPTTNEGQMADDEEGSEPQDFWDYVWGKVDGWKTWVGDLVGLGDKNGTIVQGNNKSGETKSS
jgi:hypothetical protein